MDCGGEDVDDANGGDRDGGGDGGGAISATGSWKR